MEEVLPWMEQNFNACAQRECRALGGIEKGVPHTWHMNEGRHDEDYWQTNMADYIAWYASLWIKGN